MSNEPDPENKQSETTLEDVKQLGLWASIASLSYVFWIVGGMEMIERLAYYGVRAVATIYATRAEAEGGLGVTMAKFGTLLFTWNLLQSLVPNFPGGLSDRFGYKQTIFISTIVKCFGYLLMAWFPNYDGFFAGALCLAVGTAIFKPGIQGTLILSTNRQNSSMAWGGILPDGQHRRLDRPPDRAADAPHVLDLRLLHQCRLHLPEFYPVAHLQGARQGGTP